MLDSAKLNNHFNEFLLKAIVVHCSIIALLVGIDFLFELDLLKTKKEPTDLKVIESAVRVDIVGLPKFTLQELEKMDLAEPQAVEEKEENLKPVNETSEIEFKKKAKKLNLGNLLKDFSSKKIKKVKVKEDNKIKIDRSKLKKLVLEGNKVSSGSSASGLQLDETQELYVRYIQSLPDRIKPYWKLPTYLLDKELKSRLRVFIAANGNVLKVDIFQSSGEEEFDRKAIEAVKNSSPLPKPDGSILTKVISGDVILGFPL